MNPSNLQPNHRWYRRPRNIVLEILALLLVVGIVVTAIASGRQARPTPIPLAVTGTTGTTTGTIGSTTGTTGTTGSTVSTKNGRGSDNTGTAPPCLSCSGPPCLSCSGTTGNGCNSTVGTCKSVGTNFGNKVVKVRPPQILLSTATKVNVYWISQADPNQSGFDEVFFSAQVVFASSGNPVTAADGTVTIHLANENHGLSTDCAQLYLLSNGITFGANGAAVGGYPICEDSYSYAEPSGADLVWDQTTVQASFVPSSSAALASSSTVETFNSPSDPPPGG